MSETDFGSLEQHGGTPNLSHEVRAIPGAYFDAPWYNSHQGGRRVGTGLPAGVLRLLPRSIYESLSEAGQRVASRVASSDEDIDSCWSPDWDVAQGRGGGSQMNQIHTGETLPRL